MATYKKLYNPNRSSEWNYRGSKWKLSRSKIDLFFECPRCFYIDNVLGTKRPGIPSFNLNIAVDILLKREFDTYRRQESSHPIMSRYRVDAVPFSHRDLETWRDPFIGLEYTDGATGLIVSGGLDDIWKDRNGDLIVVDYKATSKDGKIETLADSPWEEQYKRQMGVYQWLLKKNGFNVSKTGYFLYANADASKDAFLDTLHFETALVPCEGTTDWIEEVLPRIKECLEGVTYPASGSACEFCPYREACGKKLYALHIKEKKMLGF